MTAADPRLGGTARVPAPEESQNMTGGHWPAEVVGGDRAGLTAAALDAGLSSADAAERLARYGANELPRTRRTSAWRLAGGQLRDPLSLVLLAAAVLTLATGDWMLLNASSPSRQLPTDI